MGKEESVREDTYLKKFLLDQSKHSTFGKPFILLAKLVICWRGFECTTNSDLLRCQCVVLLFLKNILERGFQTTESGAVPGGSLTFILAG